MGFEFSLLPSSVSTQMAIAKIIKSNEITYQYGLTLTQADAVQLVEIRSQALSTNGRVEFGGGIIDKLIMEFCDSPYISQSEYPILIGELIEIFYYFKNECLEQLSDDELIKLMKDYFDNRCHGSLELLQNRELEQLARNIRYGEDDPTCLDSEDEIEQEDFYGEEDV